ncbi:MAG: NAD(+)/NADH kinase [gamma proteobacterium symbiont of Bathyaustriella thionipta]|nr:NAD(+)/NADH kinase [gamma proteobacterium symbiont of Bathyaustriella thionipta]
MSRHSPRVVVITRDTDYEMLIAHHATRGQAEFFLSSRRQSIAELERRHQRVMQALQRVTSQIPADWRRNRVRREELDRFLFEPQDLVIAVGQDGLVANVAKYLQGQRVIGVNPDQTFNEGILVPFAADQISDILEDAMFGEPAVQQRTMVKACLDNGQTLVALNELFIGHRSHQSARYVIRREDRSEHQSSSGIIVASGTGSSGWARSIHRERADQLKLPQPENRTLAFYVREAFPGNASGTSLTAGLLHKDAQLQVLSEMNSNGIIFGDGIENDFLQFNWGTRVTIGVAEQCLNLLRNEKAGGRST